jgi:LasA protease
MRLLIAIAASFLIVPMAPVSSAAAAPKDDLVKTVRQAALTRPRAAMMAGMPQVNLNPRTTNSWGFGTVAIPALRVPNAYPRGWLFVARRDGAKWTVALEGEPAFADLGRTAGILSADERQVFGTSARAEAAISPSDRRTGMRLPYALNQSWRLTGGPHPMSDSVRSSIDLAGGDGRVLAARGGLAYTMCGSGTGWIRVVHDRGFATDYYHLSGNIKANGKKVKEGDFLGNIGNDVSCGGSSTGAHVHFSLRRDNVYVPIDRYGFGKWVISASAGDYNGAAYHGSKRVGVGGLLLNYGGLGFRGGIVDTDGGTTLNKRAGPGTGYKVVGTVADGATVTVACSKLGTRHVGRNNYSSNLWNRLTDGTWVADVYLWTGTGDPVNGYCP